MQVTQIPDGILNMEVPKPTNEQMQTEYDYILAEQLTIKLRDKGLITVDEFNKFMAKNRQIFCPFIARIIPPRT